MWRNKLWKDFEKNPEEKFYTDCVEKFLVSTISMWRKKRWGSEEKPSYPHKFSLLLPQLPIRSKNIYILILLQKEGFYYALYL